MDDRSIRLRLAMVPCVAVSCGLIFAACSESSSGPEGPTNDATAAIVAQQALGLTNGAGVVALVRKSNKHSLMVRMAEAVSHGPGDPAIVLCRINTGEQHRGCRLFVAALKCPDRHQRFAQADKPRLELASESSPA